MLFNSFEFIFFFLPVTVFLYFRVIKHRSIETGIALLVVASLLFYGYWNPVYLALILASIAFNFFIGKRLSNSATRSKSLLITGVIANLSALAYFKYANFFLENVNALFGADWNTINVILPLAISFFTFQQISFLVDAWRGETKEYGFLHYCLFVTFFPQLIAGPIVHHKEMLPQFFDPQNLRPKFQNLVVGISIFSIGLFKKTVIADGLSPYVSPVYDTTQSVDFFLAWGATLAYTFQLYFDFSGYSDMAIGIARIFGIKLPINFFSPYKATSIVEFWRRWHITLSRFLRDYLYISLGGNRGTSFHRYRNLFLTMLLGGLWHGAGWTFVAWGALHGTYLIINHAWSAFVQRLSPSVHKRSWYKSLSWLLTFLSVIVAWVYFRAPDMSRANDILYAMSGFTGASIPNGILVHLSGISPLLNWLGVEAAQGGGSHFVGNYLYIVFAAACAFLLPNIAQIFQAHSPVIFETKSPLLSSIAVHHTLQWQLNRRWALACSFLLTAGIMTLSQVSEFLYFQF